MFLCTGCTKKYEIEHIGFVSYGRCEVCGTTDGCLDYKGSLTRTSEFQGERPMTTTSRRIQTESPSPEASARLHVRTLLNTQAQAAINSIIAVADQEGGEDILDLYRKVKNEEVGIEIVPKKGKG